jgi:hypothetical protein
MKKSLYIFVAFFMLVSCKMTERMILSEDGLIEYETEIDVTEMIGFMYPQKSIDSLKLIGQFPIDTLISYAKLQDHHELKSKDLSEEELQLFKLMDKSYLHLEINEKLAKITMKTDKMPWKDFNAYWDRLDKGVQNLEKAKPGSTDKLKEIGFFNSMSVKYDGKTFQRINDPRTQQTVLSDTALLGGAEMMKMLTYKMEYRFPKPIKTISIDNASFSLDRKYMWIEVTAADMLENPEKYNFTIEFE